MIAREVESNCTQNSFHVDLATCQPVRGPLVVIQAGLDSPATMAFMITFLLGAGFNADAADQAGALYGNSIYLGRYQIDCGYPLVGDTLRMCFGLDRIPSGKSVEDLFSNALSHGDPHPLQKLADRLMEADSRVATTLAWNNESNCYLKFFQAFATNSFLTFNYDSLPETILYRLKRWSPHDGYGLPVAVQSSWDTDKTPNTPSCALILHLHGSLCIRTSEYESRRTADTSTAMLTMRQAPQYSFDPSSIAQNFPPFISTPGEDDLERQIIAPIPDKSQGLEAAFISSTYARAEILLRHSKTLIAIGYSFNPHDRASYQGLLRVFGQSGNKRLLIISPDARAITERLIPHWPDLLIQPLPATLKQWASMSFPC